MTELTQAELAKELGFWPATAKGWTWSWQRCGRYEYRKRLTHTTNSDHLVPRGPSATDVSSLRIAARYGAGRPGLGSGKLTAAEATSPRAAEPVVGPVASHS